MPLLKIQTNQPPSDPSRLLSRASALVAELLGKPERYVMVALEPNPSMLFGGDAAPLAYLELKSIGLPGDRTRELSAALTRLVEQDLGVAPDRVYIEFADAPRHLWGWNAATF
jgi:phenylpyruvate tautomerase PptA (4-oxalocrotonate tautomerase family)